MTTQPMAGVDYPAAIRLVLLYGSRWKTCREILDEFPEGERSDAYQALASMAWRSDVIVVDEMYSLPRSR